MLKSFRNKIQSLNKTQQGILTAILILINIGIVIFWISIWALFQKEKIPPEIEVIPEKEETIEEVLERLTPAEPSLMTEEEKKELEKLLEKLTPAQPRPMTEKEQGELEELLKQLTP